MVNLSLRHSVLVMCCQHSSPLGLQVQKIITANLHWGILYIEDIFMFGLSEVPSQMYLPLSIIHYNPVCNCLIGSLIFFLFLSYVLSIRWINRKQCFAQIYPQSNLFSRRVFEFKDLTGRNIRNCKCLLPKFLFFAWCESTRICCASFQIYLFGAAREGNTKSKNGRMDLREGLACPAPLQCGLFLRRGRVIFFWRTDLEVDWERTQNYYVGFCGVIEY